MIVSETVKMKWNGKSKDHYIERGYKYTKQNEEFEVKVEDLLPTSHAKIAVSCDDCGIVSNISYRDYYNRRYEKYYCASCGRKRRQSLEPLNKNTTYTIPKPETIASYAIKNFDIDFIEKYWDFDKNVVDPFKTKYTNKQKIYVKCAETNYHDSREVSCELFFKRKQKCPYCAMRKVHPKDSLGQYIIDNMGELELEHLWSNKNIKSAFEYSTTSGDKVWWRCINHKHEDFEKRISDMKYNGFRCVRCSRERVDSFLQEYVSDYLTSIFGESDVTHEEMCSLRPVNPKTNYLMKYDNCVESIKFIAEVHGSQHYLISGFHNKTARRFNVDVKEVVEYERWKDQYKKQYALDHGYDYLEIPYWTEKDDKYKELIDNKINEILGRPTENPVKMRPKLKALN